MSIAVGVVIAWGAFWRRPKPALHERQEEWRVERNVENTPVPTLRLVAENGRLHRAAKGTRVMAESYTDAGGKRTPLGSVPLGWTSAADSEDGVSVVVFPGANRAVDLGMFQDWTTYDENRQMKQSWTFVIAPNFAPFDRRNWLQPKEGGYTIRLIIGADDGRARRYDASLNWDGTKRLVKNEWNTDELLASIKFTLRRA
jgi:hypothetical protein